METEITIEECVYYWETLDFSNHLLVMNLLAVTTKNYPELLGDIFYKFSAELRDYKVLDFDDRHEHYFVNSFLGEAYKEYFFPVGDYTRFKLFSVDTVDKEKFEFSVFPMVYLDTNIVSNMKRLVKFGPTDSALQESISILSYLNEKNGVEPNIFPYLIENMTKVRAGNLDFSNVEDNLVIAKSYIESKLNGMSKLYFESGSLIAPKVYTEYKKEIFETFNAGEITKQKMDLVMLLKSFLIHKSSNKNTEKKLVDLVEFTNTKIGFISEFTLILIQAYFDQSRELIPFLKPLNNGDYNKLDDIVGMSWDLFVYDETKRQLSYGDAYVSIPIFATLDKGLQTIIKYNPVSLLVINENEKQTLTVNKRSLTNSIKYSSVLELIDSEKDNRKKVGVNIDKTIDKTLKDLIEEYNNFFINKKS